MRIKRQVFSFSPHCCAAIFFTLLIPLLAGCQAERVKPNVLLIVLDDFGYNDLALNNGSDSPTPTLDQIARQGVRFTRHYAESSCTPSRVALLTGLYPARVGAHPNINGIDDEVLTLPDVLGEHGYTSYMLGKWHAGDAHRESRPEYQGFDHWFGFMSQLYLRGPHPDGNYTRGRPTYLNPWLESEQGDLREHEGHLTDIITEHTLRVMETEQNPWFIYLSYYAPHTPIQPSKQFSKNFPGDKAGRYQALKSQLDSNLGRIFSYLEESGKLSDTMVVVVSDNGGTAKDWPSNHPFHGTKATYTEGGVRTPLLLWWPDHWPEGQENDQIAMIFDIYPTILTALEIPVPEGLDGSDLFATTADRELRWYSHNGDMDTFGMLSADGQWRLSTWYGVNEQLYHENDFREREPLNRLKDNPDIADTMRESMLQWSRAVTRVVVPSENEEPSWTTYSGSAFRRTPLAGSHTVGFLFQRGSEKNYGTGRQLLVEQEGYIDISEADDSLRIHVDGNEVDVDIPRNKQCFSLFITSNMIKKNMVFYRKDSSSRTLVYLDGQLVASASYQNPELGKASPRNPLRVLRDPGSRWYMPATDEVFLSTRILGHEEVLAILQSDLQTDCEATSSLVDK
jgi:arylsulfatase A-like enzyme